MHVKQSMKHIYDQMERKHVKTGPIETGYEGVNFTCLLYNRVHNRMSQTRGNNILRGSLFNGRVAINF